MINGKCPNCKSPATLAPRQKKLRCDNCNKVYGVRWKGPQQPELLEAKRRCTHCEKPLLVPATANAITCPNCHTPHRIHRTEKGVRLQIIGASPSQMIHVEDYSAWRTARDVTQVIGAVLILVAVISGYLTIPNDSLIVSILLGTVGAVSFIVNFAIIRPTIRTKSRTALKTIASHYKLSATFQSTLVKNNVDVTDARGRQILDLYRSMGEEIAGTVASKQVLIGMTEGMVHLAWGKPTLIKAKSPGASTWQASDPIKASQYNQRMLWIYKTNPKKKVWFKKGRVFRVARGDRYVTEQIEVA